MNTYNTELYHFGVKGMKWGVRKQRVSSSNQRHKRKKNISNKVLVGSHIVNGLFKGAVGSILITSSFKNMDNEAYGTSLAKAVLGGKIASESIIDFVDAYDAYKHKNYKKK